MRCLCWGQRRSDVAKRSTHSWARLCLAGASGWVFIFTPVPGARARAAPEAVVLLYFVGTELVRSSLLPHTSRSVVSLMLSQKPCKAEALSCLCGPQQRSDSLSKAHVCTAIKTLSCTIGEKVYQYLTQEMSLHFSY